MPGASSWAAPRQAAQLTEVEKPNFELEKVGKALVAAAPVVLAALPALATEGTGEVFGVDRGYLLQFAIPTCAVAWPLSFLYWDWQSKQDDNDTDFFGGYDPRRN